MSKVRLKLSKDPFDTELHIEGLGDLCRLASVSRIVIDIQPNATPKIEVTLHTDDGVLWADLKNLNIVSEA